MKLFFAVLAAVLAAGFISFMTLSLEQAMHRHPNAFVKQPPNAGAQPSN